MQPLIDGSLRAAVVVRSAAAPKSYAFRLTLPDDVGALRNAAGGVDLVRRSPSRKVVGTLLVGRLEVPWAVDANGRAVRTWYAVDGNSIIQHIDFGPASAFPIVADPRIVWHWYGPGIKFNRRETRGARNRGAVIAMLAAMCAVLGPETLGIACGVGAAEAGGISAVASNAYGDDKCLEILWAIPRAVKC